MLLAAAQKVGVDGAEAWLDDPNAGLPEVRFECVCDGEFSDSEFNSFTFFYFITFFVFTIYRK